MTLGLTSSGAVKIKTDNGLRAVNCACCGGCETCGELPPKSPTGDPDFLKKLRGDAGVTPFTQATIDYSVAITLDGDPYSSASGSIVAAWIDLTNSGCIAGVIRGISSSGCDFGDCGNCVQVDTNGIGLIFLYLTNTGCLNALILEEMVFEGFLLATGADVLDNNGIPCTANSTATITINGVSYPTHDYISFEGNAVSGYLNITFS